MIAFGCAGGDWLLITFGDDGITRQVLVKGGVEPDLEVVEQGEDVIDKETVHG